MAVPVVARGEFSRDAAFQRMRELTQGAHVLTEASFSAGPGDSTPDRTLARFKVYQLPTVPFVLVMQRESGGTLPPGAVSVSGSTLHVRASAGTECSFDLARPVQPGDIRCDLSSDGCLVVTAPHEMVASHFDYIAS